MLVYINILNFSSPQQMTEQNLREFDKMTRARSSIRENERPMSPGVSSIKSSKYSETMFYIDKKDFYL